MNPLRRLAGQTAIYGLSNILGRIINFLLVPLYTRVFIPEEYGIVTEMYVYVAFLLIVLTYGMETALFRFSENKGGNKDAVFSTAFLSVLLTSSLFIFLVISFRIPLAEAMRYGGHVYYIVLLALIVGLDAIAAIPYARLRVRNRPWRFALIRFSGIIVNIGLVLFFLVFCPWLIENGPEALVPVVEKIYNEQIGVGYVFVANLAATIITLLLLSPEMFRVKWNFDTILFRQMLIFALPLLVAGMAGWANEALDKLLLKYLLPENIAMEQLGIYGAVYKLSMLMTIFVQAYRFAAEPFFFAEASQKNARDMFALIMNYFIIGLLTIFLLITLFIDLVKHFIGPEFHEGISIVPVLLLANLFLGIYWNLSIWYKLTAKTHYGAWFAIIGACITLVLNIWWIPLFGYHGAAWATLVCYFSIALLSYLTGQKNYKIPYNIKRIGLLVTTAIGVHLLSKLTGSLPAAWMYPVHLAFVAMFLLAAAFIEPSLRRVIQQVRR